MSEDVETNFWSPSRKPRRHFTEAAREASKTALAAKRAEPDRFCGIVLQRDKEVLPDAASAREAGERARAALLATPGLPRFRREG